MGINIEHLKRLPIMDILENRGLHSQMKRHDNQWSGPCPIHGGDNPRAFVVTPSKNLWYCFTQCQAGGDIIKLVRQLDNSTHHQALEYIRTFTGQQVWSKSEMVPSVSHKNAYKPFTRRLSVDQNWSLLSRKGITPEIANLFQAGVYSRKGYLNNCLVVRLHDTSGNPIGYAGRRLNEYDAVKFGKWKFPPQFPKHKMLFNFHRIKHSVDKAVVVVECPWGAMRLHQLNIPAVSLLGTHLFEKQLKILAMIPQVVLMLDGDPAGQKAAFGINVKLQAHTQSDIVALPQGQDPDDLCDLDLRNIVRPFFPT